MELILTHNNMDFDSLAAEFGVSKLHPSARMVLGYPLVGNVRNFLALYRSSLPIAQMKYVDMERVSRLFIVDCQHLDRLDDHAKKLIADPQYRCPYTIFDHHQPDPNGLGPNAHEDSVIEKVGAATTILVDQIRRHKISLTPFEATLMAIGIYEDTGCLTYSGTTEKDAACVAYLLKHGADLSIVNDYIRPKLSDEQLGLMEDLVKNAKSMTIGGARIVLASAERQTYMDGLASLTRKLTEIASADAAFSAVFMRDRIHVVGRSDSPSVDVRSVVRKFGGDGHHGAGSAVVRKRPLPEVCAEIESLLLSQVIPEKTAQEIMIAPVRTIKSSVTMDEASRIMLRYGLDGLLVAEEDKVVGVVSRRDIDQATHHKLGHAPVVGFMSRPVISISPRTPLSKIQEIMVREDIGRLPVLDHEGQLVGLVSRQDVLKTLYGNSEDFVIPEWAKTIKKDFAAAGQTVSLEKRLIDMQEKMSSLDGPTFWLCTQVGVIAAQLNMVSYVVGGCVRDLVLGVPTFDLDFVVEGSAIELATAIESAYPARLQVVGRHERFQTAKLILQADKRREVDFSTARTEFYEKPAALPTVEASGLEQDLLRRDFTINALAICLNPGRFGMLVDHFGGMDDLKRGIIRILHPFSFIEDPTRIIRAARFASRLGFHLDDKTREQAKRAISMGIFDNLGGVRMKEEFRFILESPHRLKALDLLAKLGGRLRYLDSEMAYTPRIKRLINFAQKLLALYPVSQPWTVYLALLLSDLERERVRAVLDRLHLANDQKAIVTKGLEIPSQLTDLFATMGGVSNSQVYRILNGKPPESLAVAACLAKPSSKLRRHIRRYLEELDHVSIELTGADLVEMGFAQGPEIGLALGELLDAKLDGLVSSREEEQNFIRATFGSMIQQHSC